MTRISWISSVQVAILISMLTLVGCRDSTAPSDGPVIPMKEYTLDNAREWTSIAKEHAPHIMRSVSEGHDSILVEVRLMGANEGHYIEKIGIMDNSGHELGIKSLKRERNPITYAHFDTKILPWSGAVKAFAKCNKHDLWVKEVPVKNLGG